MKIEINKIKLNTNNPRIIKDNQFEKLVQSIKDFPEMLDKRPIVVDEDFEVLGGNMRLEACKKAGLKQVTIIKADNWTKQQKEKFIIKDNISFGDWDWDILANDWDNTKLNEWGLDVWQPDESISNEKDYSINSLDDKLSRFLDAKIKNITIPFETNEFNLVVEKLETLLGKYNCEDYRSLIYKIFENEKI